ncbi:RDD family protein [Spiroplasma endosymbiont of Amphibalanus improvisus]|uniref:RDD family protein n=1 Tax=Spiroplasma endosymbiont of Amphibalanus improvisus TaxID=3066327 RepID=UPI00313CDC7E
METISNENLNKEQPIKKSFLLASRKRIIFARLLDIIFSSVVPLPLTLTFSNWSNGHNEYFLLLIFITFLWFLLYFVVIPFFWYGRTFMKWVFKIRLVTNRKKLTFISILSREMIIIFLPWFVELLVDLIVVKIFGIDFSELINNPDDNKWPVLIFQIASSFYIFWFLGLIIGICLNDDRQFFMDRTLDLYIIQKPKIEKNASSDNNDSKKNQHIHLGDNKPGIISDDDLKKINEL